ncbi:MAG: hypothetical protein SF053_14165 [Bacteroidia bacterium]|nr:hypothetical protein [Bacteroidia bacterium]
MHKSKERYLQPFEIAKFSREEQMSYEDSLKYYRDLKNSLDLAREEGKIEGRVEGKIEGKIEGKKEGLIEGLTSVVLRGAREGLSIKTLASLTGLSEEEVRRMLDKT